MEGSVHCICISMHSRELEEGRSLDQCRCQPKEGSRCPAAAAALAPLSSGEARRQLERGARWAGSALGQALSSKEASSSCAFADIFIYLQIFADAFADICISMQSTA